jgi:hypothetical protein
MSEAAMAFTVGTAECRVLPDGIMAYEPDVLYRAPARTDRSGRGPAAE